MVLKWSTIWDLNGRIQEITLKASSSSYETEWMHDRMQDPCEVSYPALHTSRFRLWKTSCSLFKFYCVCCARYLSAEWMLRSVVPCHSLLFPLFRSRDNYIVHLIINSCFSKGDGYNGKWENLTDGPVILSAIALIHLNFINANGFIL